MTLYLVRHGVTIWGEEERVHGHSDAPLSEEGRRQARAVAERLRKEGQFSALYSSDLGRAVETAKEISQVVGLPLLVDPRLREIYFGKFEGLTNEEAERFFPQQFKAWREDPVRNRPPEGERVESLMSRVQAFIEEVKSAYPEGKVIAVSHGGMIRAAVILALKLDLATSWRKVYVRWGSVTVIEIPSSGPPLLKLFNDACHLCPEF